MEVQKKTTEFKDYLDNKEIPVLVYKKVEYRDPYGKIDKDKSFFYRETPDGSSYSETIQEHSDSNSDTESDTESDIESDKLH